MWPHSPDKPRSPDRARQNDFPSAIDGVLDLVFVLDVVLQFFHGFEDQGFPVTELRRVARRYLRSWFALDFFVAIPFERILAGASWAKPLKLIKTVPHPSHLP